jgi:hypothetical protein
MRRNSALLVLAVTVLAACGSQPAYRQIRLEIPTYSPLQLEEFDDAVICGFRVGEGAAAIDLNKEITEYLRSEIQRKLPFQRVLVQPVALDSEEVFSQPEFWKSLAPGSVRVLYVTGKAQLTRETRKAVVERPKEDIEDPFDRQKAFTERTVFSLDLHIYLIRGDSGEVLFDRDFKETKTYVNPNQRADFAFYDLVQRAKAKLFRPIMSEGRMQERYLILK